MFVCPLYRGRARKVALWRARKGWSTCYLSGRAREYRRSADDVRENEPFEAPDPSECTRSNAGKRAGEAPDPSECTRSNAGKRAGEAPDPSECTRSNPGERSSTDSASAFSAGGWRAGASCQSGERGSTGSPGERSQSEQVPLKSLPSAYPRPSGGMLQHAPRLYRRVTVYNAPQPLCLLELCEAGVTTVSVLCLRLFT